MGAYLDKKRRKWRYHFIMKGVRYTGQYFETKREALRAEAGKRTELENPKRKTPTDMIFLDLANERLDYIKEYDQPRHYQDVWYYARRWIEIWGNLLCSEIIPDMVQSFILQRKKAASAQTANKDLRLLRSFFSYGVRRKWIVENPALEVDFLPVKNKKNKPPPKKDMLKVILVADPDTQDYLWTIALTLARKGEIDKLDWDDVDFENRLVWLRTRKKKGGNEDPRPVPMLDKLYDVLHRRYERRNLAKPWVFWHRYWSRKEGKWVERPYQDRKGVMKALCEKAGVGYFRFHALRHLGASMMAEEGKPLRAIQRILGHENIKTTERYLHSLGEAEWEAIKALKSLNTAEEESQKNVLGGGFASMPERYWKRKVQRPSHERLKSEVKELGFRRIGRRYGVSDTTIRRWLRFYEMHGEDGQGEGHPSVEELSNQRNLHAKSHA